ncbi:MAG TPA: hypothetical protein VGJ84_05795 [Polyangiaceae bacterium]
MTGCLHRLSALLVLVGFLTTPNGAHADPNHTSRLRLFADLDDDDDDGVADALSTDLKHGAGTDVVWLDPLVKPTMSLQKIEGEAARVVADDRILGASSNNLPHTIRRLGLQGVAAGRSHVQLSGLDIEASVVEVIASDESGKYIDLAISHAEIARTLPPELLAREDGHKVDGEGLRWIAIGPREALPERARLVSTAPNGTRLDSIEPVLFVPTDCPDRVAPEFSCSATTLIRATIDQTDRAHPESSDRSLTAEVGGRILLYVDQQKASSIRVGGPRDSTLGPLGRFQAQVRMHLVRLSRAGAVPIGGNDRGALGLARQELRTASSLWGQCGIHIDGGPIAQIQIVDPPPPYMLAVGCDLGLPASGGMVAFAIGKKQFRIRTERGQTPTEVANAVAAALRRAGFGARLSPNTRITSAALSTVDVLVSKPDGALATLQTGAGDGSRLPLSTDASLDVCLGEVELSDGLTHFDDFDAAAGTVEERALIKAFDDGDPSTIDVFIVPAFAQSGRIGESFIYSKGSSVRNVVIMDRAAVRAGARSFALAHELGHIFLEMPGHPDDFGVDQSSSLMDADAADPTIFGPRRLTMEECERAFLQSGPGAPVPLLNPWPLYRHREKP